MARASASRQTTVTRGGRLVQTLLTEEVYVLLVKASKLENRSLAGMLRHIITKWLQQPTSD